MVALLDGMVEDEMDVGRIAQDDVLVNGLLEIDPVALQDGEHALLLREFAQDGNQDAATAQVHRREHVGERDRGRIEVRPVHHAIELDAQLAADELIDAGDSVGFHGKGRWLKEDWAFRGNL